MHVYYRIFNGMHNIYLNNIISMGMANQTKHQIYGYDVPWDPLLVSLVTQK